MWQAVRSQAAVAAGGSWPGADAILPPLVLLSCLLIACLCKVVKQQPVHWVDCRFSEFSAEVRSYFNLDFGDEMGVSTGWTSLDEVYRVRPGLLGGLDAAPAGTLLCQYPGGA